MILIPAKTRQFVSESYVLSESDKQVQKVNTGKTGIFLSAGIRDEETRKISGWGENIPGDSVGTLVPVQPLTCL